MNIRETVTIRSPNGKDEACAKFTIDEVARPFTFLGATEENEKYVFSAWVMAEEESTLNIEGKEIPVTTEWKRQKVSYVSSTNPLKIYFNKNGVYYFYQSQLEIGDLMTDWAPSPEDIEEAIKSANAKLELKVNKDTLKSEINALADTFTFTGNGFVVNAKNLTITEDGTIKATNGEFTGTIKGSSGEFTEGFAVRLDTGYSDGSTFDLLMEEDVESELKSFFVGYSGNDEMGQAGLWVSPGNVTIEGMNIKSYASRVYEISSNMQITLDAPEIYVQDSMYSGESFEMIEFFSRIKHQNILWSGSYYMTETQTIELSEPISKQPNGIVLVFSRYSEGTVRDYNFNYFFVPKKHVSMYEGKGLNFFMSCNNVFTKICSKYLYIYDDKIIGNADNNVSGTANGITYDNKSMVLRNIIGI